MSLLLYFSVFAFLKCVVDAALDVNVPSEIIAVNGGLAVFEISYTESGGDTFNSFALNKGAQNVFTAPLAVQGQYFRNGSFSGLYETRASTNYYFGRTQFTITLSGITTSDEGEYQVKFTKNRNIAVPSVVTQLVLDVLPSTPSISGAPTQSVLGGAGPTVLLCTANLGKPQASMVWSRRIGSGAYTNTTENVNTTITRNNDGTTSGSSALTVNLDTADDGVQFRCQVSNRQATLSAETGAIEVTAPVPVSDANIKVCKTFTTQCTSPFDYYINDRVSLTCGVKSPLPNPAPHEYKWYQTVNESSVISGPVLSFTIIESEIVYVCNASNTVRGVTRTGSKQVTIRATAKPTSLTPSVDTTPSKDTTTKPTISDKTTDGTTTDDTLTAGAIAGIAIGAVVVLIILIALTVYCVRKKKADTLKDDAKYMDEGMKNPGMDSPDEGYNTQPDVVAPDQLYAAVNKPKKNKPADPQDPRSKNVEGLVYADLALDDTPRSRKPIQAYELTGTEYAEIMRK